VCVCVCVCVCVSAVCVYARAPVFMYGGLGGLVPQWLHEGQRTVSGICWSIQDVSTETASGHERY